MRARAYYSVALRAYMRLCMLSVRVSALAFAFVYGHDTVLVFLLGYVSVIAFIPLHVPVTLRSRTQLCANGSDRLLLTTARKGLCFENCHVKVECGKLHLNAMPHTSMEIFD